MAAKQARSEKQVTASFLKIYEKHAPKEVDEQIF
jgi:hypothetical protein